MKNKYLGLLFVLSLFVGGCVPQAAFLATRMIRVAPIGMVGVAGKEAGLIAQQRRYPSHFHYENETPPAQPQTSTSPPAAVATATDQQPCEDALNRVFYRGCWQK